MRRNQVDAAPILVMGKVRSDALLARVRAAVQIWSVRWGLCAAAEDLRLSLNLANERTDRPHAGVDICLSGVAESNEAIRFCATAGIRLTESLLKIPAALVSAESEYVSESIADGVQSKLLHSFCESIAESVQGTKWGFNEESLGTAIASPSMRGAWSIVIEFVRQGHRPAVIELTLSTDFIARLIPSKALGEPISKRNKALGDEKVRLQAVLGEASVSVGDLASITVDDVLIIDGNFAALGSLVNEAGIDVAKVALGRSGARRAVQITALIGK